MTELYIPHSQKSLRDFSESKSEKSMNNFQGAWGDFVIFFRKSDFCTKVVEFSPKSENEENGSQKTKKTITFIRVGAMGAEMSFLLQKWEILMILRFGSQNWIIYTFWSKIRKIIFPMCSWRWKVLGSCSSPRKRYVFLDAFFVKTWICQEIEKNYQENRIPQRMFSFYKKKSW